MFWWFSATALLALFGGIGVVKLDNKDSYAIRHDSDYHQNASTYFLNYFVTKQNQIVKNEAKKSNKTKSIIRQRKFKPDDSTDGVIHRLDSDEPAGSFFADKPVKARLRGMK